MRYVHPCPHPAVPTGTPAAARLPRFRISFNVSPRSLLCFVFMLMFATAPVLASPPDTVVLLHGLGRGPLAMKRLERTLRSEGYHVLNLRYASQTHDIATLARTTLAPVLGPDAPHARVHLVTHSLGGILVRQYLHDHGVPSRLGRIVMLAPPNRGSEVVDRLRTWPVYRWFNGPAGLQLGTDAQSVPNRLGPVPAGVEVGVIAGDFSWNPLLSSAITGPNDGKVSVARSHIDGERDHIVVSSSHTWLMWRAFTLTQVSAFLRDGHFVHRSPRT